MPREWTRWCKRAGLRVDGNLITVQFGDERRHQVRLHEEGDALRLVGVVARPTALQTAEAIALRSWRRNRSTQLVGFRIDDRGRLVGEAWVPTAGLTEDELVTYVHHVAAECDRLEYLLTGRDTE